ncbi:MAG: phosphoribosyl-ATP diphosphatase [Rhizobacter sp.]|nr:phosphoribosyl-ATP diphosphatase [Rhizobacter sp.]
MENRRPGLERPGNDLQMSVTEMNGDDTLARLAKVIESRKGGDPDKSYVARLFHKGHDAILKKIGEEATEVVMACKDGERPKIVGEVADLWFHCLLALNAYGLAPADVLAELARREGLSGLEEFAARKSQQRDKDGS